jgi:hypothetical protein
VTERTDAADDAAAAQTSAAPAPLKVDLKNLSKKEVRRCPFWAVGSAPLSLKNRTFFRPQARNNEGDDKKKEGALLLLDFLSSSLVTHVQRKVLKDKELEDLEKLLQELGPALPPAPPADGTEGAAAVVALLPPAEV